MKKLFVLMMVCVMLLSSFFAVHVSAASEFDVQNGVLVKYNGTSSDVTIPSGVAAVGATAFMNNTAVRSVTLPSSVYTVGERAFYGCTALSTVSGGDNVNEVGDLAFQNTPYLNNSTAKYLMLGNVLLWYNGTAGSVTIPSRCTAVASYAFLRCTYLTSFTAYEGLISVGTGAFFDCSKLSSVNLPSTVSSVGAYAFDGTPYLSAFDTFAVDGDGVLIKYTGSASNVEIPYGVKRIAPHAFDSSKITSVTVPETVYAIDALAFADCTGLSEIDFSDGLVMIGDSAFRGCKSLTKLITPSTLSYIGQKAFTGSALTGASLPGDNLTVSYNAFKGCESLTYVLLSDGVTAVYDNAFDGCKGLGGVSVPRDLTDISSASFSGCGNIILNCDPDAKAIFALSAYPANTLMGDVDSDDRLSIIDATHIQCFRAKLEDFSGAQTAAADINFDGEVNIIDAVDIQKRIAKIE